MTAYNQLSRKNLVSDIKEQLGGMFCDTMVGLVSETTRYKYKLEVHTIKSPLSRFDAQCLKDIVDKYEENLGFEKAFVSILGPKTKREIDEIRRFYKKDFKGDLDEDLLR